MLKRLLLLALLMQPGAALAVEPDEMLSDPALEARARDISKQLRCVVCQNQDIDSSNAGVARDLRLLVRERLVAGDSNDATISYIRARYGDYVLLRPPFDMRTLALWLAPPALVLSGLGAAAIVLARRRRRKALGRLTDLEEAEIKRFLTSENEREEQGGRT